MIDSTGVEWPDKIWVHRRGEKAEYSYNDLSIPPGAFYSIESQDYDMPQEVYYSFPSQIECPTESDAEDQCIEWLIEKLGDRIRKAITVLLDRYGYPDENYEDEANRMIDQFKEYHQ